MVKVFTEEVPYYMETQAMACLNVIAGRRPPRPPNVLDSVWNLIEECWRAQPAERPHVLTVYNRLACIP